jgi:glutamate-1-semialdehyde 2,1-aminomutase
MQVLASLYSLLRLLFHATWACADYLLTAALLEREKKHCRSGVILARTLTRLGPLYIKIGQILSTRADLLPQAVIRHLSKLQDEIPPMPRRDLVKVLRRSYGMPVDRLNMEVFSAFDETPVASASIAQVHRAVLASGETVAVKIVKRGVKKALSVNTRILLFLTRVVSLFVPAARKQNLPRRLEDISRLLAHQADMGLERMSQERVAANFSDHPYLHVPRVYAGVSRDDVLVMDFVDGIRGKEPERVHMDRRQLAKRAQDIIYTMLFVHGYSHGDPHPGNFFYSEKGDFHLVDFGITVELTEDEKWGLSSFIYACIRQDWPMAVRRLTKSFVLDSGGIRAEWSRYEGKMMEVLRRHFDITSRHWSVVHFLSEASDVLSAFGSHYSYNFHKVILVLLSCEGVVALIDPDVDIWENARKFTDRFSPYMSEELKDRFDRYFGEKLPKSLELRSQAAEYLIAPTHFDRYFLPSAYPLIVTRAKGCMLTDVDGNDYIDLALGYGPHILGYGHQVFKQAIAEALELGSLNAMGHMPELELARMIVDALPAAEKVIFSNSGTEAVVQAFRICRGYRKRDSIAKFEGHYHGYSDQGMVSSWFRFRGPRESPEPISGSLGVHSALVKDTLVLQYGMEQSLDRIRENADRLACVILEPMPAASAYYDIPFLQGLRQLCTELDLPLVFDEVVSGFRTDYGGVQTLTGVQPDLTCLGKIIGGGVPCGAVAGRARFLDTAKTTLDPFVDYDERVFVGGTMSGNTIACTVGKAMLSYLRDHRDLYGRLHVQTQRLAKELTSVAAEEKVSFRMKAAHSLFSMTFSYNSSQYYRERTSGSNHKANIALSYYMRKHQVYLPEVHTMFLCEAHEDRHLDQVRDAFRESIREMAADGFFTC